jgi:hypothetical protein
MLSFAMFMQRFTGTKVRTIIMRNGDIYRIESPTEEHLFWTVRGKDKAIEFPARFDESGNDLGRKEAQEFLQEQRGLK